MRISDNEVKNIISGHAVVEQIAELGQTAPQREADKPLVRLITRQIIDMPDRDDMVADLKDRIEAGDYNPTGDEIAEAMIRRAIADSVR